ncbi:hypothetical protein [Streptomyces clavuligerus]|uniref:Uncharacterized protein n=1 Tax=Streptomyces clavuligerus TaxID=1901 RepID=E2Q766_STRCL|nr:hypothetical protein [Streptomyces clavuligerus]AXU16757.1 hypothetical protein D1794_27630 [Streptomyces clavuligerus]EFG05313.1 Hypothetical protein SCLAV_0237 [Streptomyces clavuligerus]MBY6306299.1 hypothetical protein [Streptomyces clavuligerus]QCS09517.1 hypothetical protein CRV15_26995 [Streptomyces clavuligerus]QPJ91733.1 hypothetical protein GE265_01165 [Streptomyces clavuligerus]
MSAPRRLCPVCRREIAVVAGRYARHDPAPRRAGAAELVSCPGSRRQAPHDPALRPTLDGSAPTGPPGQLPLF